MKRQLWLFGGSAGMAPESSLRVGSRVLTIPFGRKQLQVTADFVKVFSFLPQEVIQDHPVSSPLDLQLVSLVFCFCFLGMNIAKGEQVVYITEHIEFSNHQAHMLGVIFTKVNTQARKEKIKKKQERKTFQNFFLSVQCACVDVLAREMRRRVCGRERERQHVPIAAVQGLAQALCECRLASCSHCQMKLCQDTYRWTNMAKIVKRNFRHKQILKLDFSNLYLSSSSNQG